MKIGIKYLRKLGESRRKGEELGVSNAFKN